MSLTDRRYSKLVREERQFCALLWHLLVSRQENLSGFMSLVAQRSGAAFNHAKVDGSEELYVEYSSLRDDWFAIGRDNSEKRRRIESLLEASGLTAATTLPAEIADLNALFIGERGRKIRNDVAYPGSWSVKALYEFAGPELPVFRELCRIKWAHNIKPDLVILFREGPRSWSRRSSIAARVRIRRHLTRSGSSTSRSALVEDASVSSSCRGISSRPSSRSSASRSSSLERIRGQLMGWSALAGVRRSIRRAAPTRVGSFGS